MLGTQQVLHRRGENAFAHLYAGTVVKSNDKSDSKKDGMFTESETLDFTIDCLEERSALFNTKKILNDWPYGVRRHSVGSVSRTTLKTLKLAINGKLFYQI